MARPTSAAAAGLPVLAPGSKVMLTRVVTSAAAPGAASASWAMICRAASGAAGSRAAATLSASAVPGSGAVAIVTVAPPAHRDVAQAGQPPAPVRDPRVGVGAVGEPRGGGHHPKRRGHQAGAAVGDDPVPAAAPVLAVQQREGREDAGHLPLRRVRGDDPGPVGGVLPPVSAAPPCSPEREERQRLPSRACQREEPAASAAGAATSSARGSAAATAASTRSAASIASVPAAPSPSRPTPRRRRQPP